MPDTEFFKTINNAHQVLIALENSSLDSAGSDIDDNEDSESEEDAESDARAISADQRNEQTSSETSLGSSAAAAS